ncbi:MAG: fumarate hydratase [Oscillospiraceae bacterium]|jgi:fumarate hydratase subunit alpha|nr:fumarate hydratase [Oscillospiraceae bacterium]
MREIEAAAVTRAVETLCIESNVRLGADIRAALRRAHGEEHGALPRAVLGMLLENADAAEADNLPMCQDTGLATVFVALGQEVHIAGGALEEAIQAGVARGYERGFLRKSVVCDPIDRRNTGDNTPAVVYYNVVPGDTLTLTVAPKGFGSENMGRVAMLTPADGLAGVMDFVVDTVRRAASNPCPPVIVGVGVGGTMDKAALLAKQALLRPVGSLHPDPVWAEREASLLRDINALGIGPAGFGGQTTALAVHILPHPTHIAGLPVAVNIGCHATRHSSVEL